MIRVRLSQYVWSAISLATLITLGLAATWYLLVPDVSIPVPVPDNGSSRSARGRATLRVTAEAEQSPLPTGPSGIELTDVLSETEITFVHTDGGSGKRYIMEAMSAGIALFDFDGDELVDIYFLNGAPLLGTETDAKPTNALYRNLGNWRFVDVTLEAGVGDTTFGLGVTIGDYNNDGHPDIYLNNFGPNILYRNDGDGTFTDITAKAGVADGDKVGAGACFIDIEGDGDLDLYVSNYVQFAYETHKAKTIRGQVFYPGPLDHEPAGDTLYRNNADGTFTDITTRSGIASHSGTGMGITSGDFDDDGDTDVFIANDEMANALLENDGNGNFRETAVLSGVAYDMSGIPQASMGVDCGDFDNDGKLDLYVTSYENELTTLYHNLDSGFFHDVTRVTGAAQGTRVHVTWGNGFVDFDRDGDRDIFITCGHTEKNIAAISAGASCKARNILLMNTDAPTRFVNVSRSSGSGMLAKHASRGAGFDDLDNDGDVDVVILNSCEQPTILRNDTNNNHHWLEIRLVGIAANRAAVGSRVVVTAGDLVQIDEVHSGRGYQSHWGNRLYFGLGQRSHVDRVEVRWLGGGADEVTDVEVDQIITIVQRSAN